MSFAGFHHLNIRFTVKINYDLEGKWLSIAKELVRSVNRGLVTCLKASNY